MEDARPPKRALALLGLSNFHGSKRFSPVLGEQHALVSGGLMRWTGWVHGALVQAQLPAKTGALGLSYLGRFTRDGDNLVTRDVAGCIELNC